MLPDDAHRRLPRGKLQRLKSGGIITHGLMDHMGEGASLATVAADTPSKGLYWNVLDEPLIRWRSLGDGALHHGSLPEIMAALAVDRLRDFPALRPHQRHPWHAFLVQLAAIALHRAGRSDPGAQALDWHAALRALTPNDPDDAAWCLVTPPERPALLQPPVPGENPVHWKNLLHAPDAIDMLITAKNHDLKSARMRRAQADDWLFALISLQTQEGFLGLGKYGVSRMNGGFASRPGVSAAAIGAWGQRWRIDIVSLLSQRTGIAEHQGLAAENGHALLWLLPWNGKASVAFASLDPFYIEICRRVRLSVRQDHVVARVSSSQVARIAAEDRNGVTGDPWSPIDTVGAKALTVSTAGFDYKLISQLLSGDRFSHGAAWRLDGWPPDAPLEVIAQATARGQGKTGGYHERRVPVSPKLRRLLAGSQRQTVAAIASKRIDAIAAMRKLLWHALVLLFSGGDKDSRNDKASEQATLFARSFEQQEDSRFFYDLSLEAEADDGVRDVLHVQWLAGLAERARPVLLEAFRAGPHSTMQRYKAQSLALARFDAGLGIQGGGKPILPDLACFYAQQGSRQPPKPQGEHL